MEVRSQQYNSKRGFRMRRSLKVVSRKQKVIEEGDGTIRRSLIPSDLQSEQRIAQFENNQSTVNALNELARTISHYLNNPLTILLGKLELLEQENENGGASKENVRRFVEAGKREIFRIDAIVKAFHDIGTVQHKTYPPGVKMLDVEREIKIRTKEACFLR
jgi:signal transduction histidine kinase